MRGMGIRRTGLFNADLAALSAFLLPVMPMWLGNQQNITLKDYWLLVKVLHPTRRKTGQRLSTKIIVF